MKRLLILLCVGCMVLSMAACSPVSDLPVETTAMPNPETTVTDAGNETTEPSSPTVGDAAQMPMSAISLPVVSESKAAADGVEIFRYTYPNISITLPDPDVADKVIVNFLNRVDATRTNAEQICAMAETAYRSSEHWTPYQCVVSYTPMRMDLSVLSLLSTHTSFSGSSHPETVYETVNYDLITGDPLSIYNIIDFESNSDTLDQLVTDALRTQEADKYLFDDYAETVSDLLSGTKIDSRWYFNSDGLCFFFAPYEIAPYSSGLITAVLPYSELVGIVSDPFFPAERDGASGEVLLQSFSDENAQQFSQIAELVIEPDTDRVLLYTDHLIYDVQVEYGTWSASGAVFSKQYTVFCATSLTPGDALMIEASFADTLPCLRVRYQSNGAETYAYLSLDEAGQPALIQQ